MGVRGVLIYCADHSDVEGADRLAVLALHEVADQGLPVSAFHVRLALGAT
jgi:hypothetical protein